MVGSLKKRFDIVVYSNDIFQQMVIECKSMNETLTLQVLNKVLRYNQRLQAPVFVITNGKNCFAFEQNLVFFANFHLNIRHDIADSTNFVVYIFVAAYSCCTFSKPVAIHQWDTDTSEKQCYLIR